MMVDKSKYSSEFYRPLIDELHEEVGKILARGSILPQMSYEAMNSFLEDGKRQKSEEIYFARRKEVVAMALYLQIKEDEIVLEKFKNAVWDICLEYSWALPAHYKSDQHNQTVDLFAAETAHMMAEFTVIFGDKFDKLLLNEINAQIMKRVLQPFEEFVWGFEKLENNWSAVCAGAIGMTVLVMDFEDDFREGILRRCLKAMEYFLAGYGDDGCCTEGISYWVYGFGFYVYFAQLYQHYTGNEILKGEKIEAIAAFAGLTQDNNGQFLMFSDAMPKTVVPTGLGTYLNDKFAKSGLHCELITSFHFDHCYRWAHLSRNLWWSREDGTKSGQKKTVNHYFSCAQWLVYKKESLYFAAKGGHNNESHNHNDLGSFVFGIGAKLTFVDFGAASYSADYFGDKRYEFLQSRSDWHSVVTINNNEQIAGPNYHAQIIKHQTDETGFEFILDLSSAYKEQTKIVRTYRIEEASKKLTILDETDATIYGANFVTYEKPYVGDGEIIYKDLKMLYDCGIMDVRVEEAVLINHFNEEERVYALRFTAIVKQAKYKFEIM